MTFAAWSQTSQALALRFRRFFASVLSCLLACGEAGNDIIGSEVLQRYEIKGLKWNMQTCSITINGSVESKHAFKSFKPIHLSSICWHRIFGLARRSCPLPDLQNNPHATKRDKLAKTKRPLSCEGRGTNPKNSSLSRKQKMDRNGQKWTEMDRNGQKPQIALVRACDEPPEPMTLVSWSDNSTTICRIHNKNGPVIWNLKIRAYPTNQHRTMHTMHLSRGWGSSPTGRTFWETMWRNVRRFLRHLFVRLFGCGWKSECQWTHWFFRQIRPINQIRIGRFLNANFGMTLHLLSLQFWNCKLQHETSQQKAKLRIVRLGFSNTEDTNPHHFSGFAQNSLKAWTSNAMYSMIATSKWCPLGRSQNRLEKTQGPSPLFQSPIQGH